MENPFQGVITLQAIASMGIALGQIFMEPSMINSCQMLETNASWGYRLSKLKVGCSCFSLTFAGFTESHVDIPSYNVYKNGKTLWLTEIHIIV